MTIVHNECVRDCAGNQFDFANKAVASCDDIPAAPDGSETIVTAGANITVTGTGTAANPYVVTAAGPGAAPDGSETIVTAGTNVTVTGAGTVASPYVVNAAADGSETEVTAGANITVTGTGTAADPYVVSNPSPQLVSRSQVGTLALANGVFAVVPLATSHEVSADFTYDAGTSELVAVTAGVYDVRANGQVNTSVANTGPNGLGATHYFEIQKNGAAVAPQVHNIDVYSVANNTGTGGTPQDTANGGTVSAFIPLAVGDRLRVRAYSQAQAPFWVSGAANFISLQALRVR